LFYGKIKTMATYIYKINNVKTIDGMDIEIIPLKIKYMRQVMDVFALIEPETTEDELIDILCECVRIGMNQYYPKLSGNVGDILDNFDLNTLYDILEMSVGIKIKQKFDELDEDKKVSNSEEGSNWDNLDLAKLENEIFLLGIWKDYNELELSLSMPELLSTISSSRDLDYQEKKFLAAMQGVDLEAESGSNKGQKEWEDMKARVFSNGATGDSNDILALQGQNAAKAGFGIGMGLDYEDSRDPAVML
jgi:hypothetical protein